MLWFTKNERTTLLDLQPAWVTVQVTTMDWELNCQKQGRIKMSEWMLVELLTSVTTRCVCASRSPRGKDTACPAISTLQQQAQQATFWHEPSHGAKPNIFRSLQVLGIDVASSPWTIMHAPFPELHDYAQDSEGERCSKSCPGMFDPPINLVRLLNSWAP
jgi:hypothetical protein